MAKDPVIVIRGVLDYAKIVGDARPHTGEKKYDKGPYWSVDITPDAKSLELVKKFGITEKLKTVKKPDDNRVGKGEFIGLRVLENRSDGSKNNPPKVVDIQGKPWGNELIGNGTIADVKVKIVDYGRASEKGVYLQAVRILDHVPYESKAFDDLDEDDEFFSEGSKRDAKGGTEEDHSGNPDDLDDDIPF